MTTVSVIFAAGKGSRMKGFEGNKTLLPLVPGPSPFEGTHPILLQVLNSLPPGPKALVVNYMKKDVIAATRSLNLTYCEQPILNGTGGALMAAREFLENQHKRDSDILLAIVLQERDRHIGNSSLNRINPVDATAELSIAIGEKIVGKRDTAMKRRS